MSSTYQIFIGAVIGLFSLVNFYFLVRHFRWYRKTWMGQLALSSKLMAEHSRPSGVAGSVAGVLLGVAMIVNVMRPALTGATFTCFAVALATALIFAGRDVKRAVTGPRPVTKEGEAVSDWLVSKWAWIVALALASGVPFADQRSQAAFLLRFPLALVLSLWLLNHLSMAIWRHRFRAPFLDEPTDTRWHDWILLLPYATLTGVVIYLIGLGAHLLRAR